MAALLNQGIDLMLVGMGVVFAFLVMLVLITSVMSRLVSRYFPEPLASSPAPALSSGAVDVAPVTVRAIEEAVRQHRARQRGTQA